MTTDAPRTGDVAPPFTPRFAHDPYPTYDWLRREHPCHPIRFPFAPDLAVWLVSRYADVRRVLTSPAMTNDPANASAAFQNSGLPFAYRSVFGTRLDLMDPPRHELVQRHLRVAFSRRRVARLAAAVEARAETLVWGLGATGESDLVAGYCEPLARGTLADCLVLDPDQLTHTVGLIGCLVSTDHRDRVRWAESCDTLAAHIDDLVERKRAAPDGSLLANIATTAHLSEDERTGLVFLLLAAGYSSAMNFIANALLALCRFPGQRGVILRGGHIDRALDEFLRFDGPTTTGAWRFTRDEVVLGGQVLPAGAAILPLVAAANRDPGMFYEPDTLLLRRFHNPHLAFGAGVHRCLGTALAKTLARIAIPAFVTRFPGFRLAIPFDDLRYREAIGTRALLELPVRLS